MRPFSKFSIICAHLPHFSKFRSAFPNALSKISYRIFHLKKQLFLPSSQVLPQRQCLGANICEYSSLNRIRKLLESPVKFYLPAGYYRSVNYPLPRKVRWKVGRIIILHHLNYIRRKPNKVSSRGYSLRGAQRWKVHPTGSSKWVRRKRADLEPERV